MSFPLQLAETKSTARVDSLYGLRSEKKAREFLDMTRSRLRLSIMPWEMQLTSGIGDQLRSPH